MVTKKLKWSNDDTPLPKKGQVLSNMFGEKYKVIKKGKKGKKDTLITFEKI
jgi:hypothetical protein